MRHHPRSLMLFAAGLGTRMAPLTATRPKPLVEVAGRPLIDHALSLADAAGIGRIVVNLHYLPDQLRAHLAPRPEIALSEEPELLDTGGGLRQALPLLGGGPVFTMNTDAAWTGPNPFDTLRAAWDPDRMDALLLLVPQERALAHTGRGDFLMDAGSRLTPGPGHVYTGAQILRTGALAAIPERVFSLWTLWNKAMAAGRAFGVLHPGGWCDVGRPEAIPLAEAMLREAEDV